MEEACWSLEARYAAIDVPLPSVRPLTVTHMRAPLERIVSEYYYRGPGLYLPDARGAASNDRPRFGIPLVFESVS